MRGVLAIVPVLFLAACADDHADGCDYNGHHHELGEWFPVECYACGCTEPGRVTCAATACPPGAGADTPPNVCTGDSLGVACGGYFCAAGEQCVDGACRCGALPSCGAGDHCAHEWPPPANLCGDLCCGASATCPEEPGPI
jgi:hypothetical protein